MEVDENENCDFEEVRSELVEILALKCFFPCLVVTGFYR